MKLSEVLPLFGPIVGLSSLIGAPSSVSSHCAEATITLSEARERRQQIADRMNNATSDYAYWGYAGQHSYWVMVCDLLEAAELVGADDLPYVSAPDTKNGVVMDLMGRMEKFGREVLTKAKSAAPSQETA